MIRLSLLTLFATLLAGPVLAAKSQCDFLLSRRTVEVKAYSTDFPWDLHDVPEVFDIEVSPRNENKADFILSFKGKYYRLPARSRLEALLALHSAVVPYAAVEAQIVAENGMHVKARLHRFDAGFTNSSENPDEFIDQLYNDVYAASVVRSPVGVDSGRLEVRFKIKELRHTVTLADEGNSLLFLVGQSFHKLTSLKRVAGEIPYHVEVGYSFIDLPKTSIGPIFYLTKDMISGMKWSFDSIRNESKLTIFGETPSGEPIELVSLSYAEGLKTLEALLEKRFVRLLISLPYTSSGKSSRHEFTFVN